MTDLRLLKTLLVLNTVLLPVRASKGFKPTVATAQLDTFLEVSNREEVMIEVQRVYDIYEKQNSPPCPKLVVVGEAASNGGFHCMVVYRTLAYEFSSIVRAVDVLIKLHLVLGLPYSKTSKLVWIFIEKYFYEVESNYGGYMCINRLIDFINNDSDVPPRRLC